MMLMNPLLSSDCFCECLFRISRRKLLMLKSTVCSFLGSGFESAPMFSAWILVAF